MSKKWKILMMCLMVLALLAMPLLACGDDTKEYDLTISVDPSGGGTVNPSAGTHTYDEDEVVTITATAAEGYMFDSWTGDVADTAAASTTVTMDANQTVTANFTVATVNYTLTVAIDPEGGGTTNRDGTHEYAEGTEVTITATAAEGYIFDSWTGDVADTSAASTTVTMDEDQMLTANFVQVFTLTLVVAGEGSIDPGEGTHEYAPGTEVTITATETYYKFDGWTGDVADTAAVSTTVTMDQDQTVTANFGDPMYPMVTYNMTYVDSQLEAIFASDTEEYTLRRFDMGPEDITTDYFTGTCEKFVTDYGDTEPVLYRGAQNLHLISQVDWILDGRVQYSESMIAAAGGAIKITSKVTFEWEADNMTYTWHTVLVPALAETHLETYTMSVVGMETVTVPAGEFADCVKIEISNTAIDGVPLDEPVLAATEYWTTDGLLVKSISEVYDGILTQELASIETPVT